MFILFEESRSLASVNVYTYNVVWFNGCTVWRILGRVTMSRRRDCVREGKEHVLSTPKRAKPQPVALRLCNSSSMVTNRMHSRKGR